MHGNFFNYLVILDLKPFTFMQNPWHGETTSAFLIQFEGMYWLIEEMVNESMYKSSWKLDAITYMFMGMKCTSICASQNCLNLGYLFW
jgi:hypothetical protein